jgi:hypothetical protein
LQRFYWLDKLKIFLMKKPNLSSVRKTKFSGSIFCASANHWIARLYINKYLKMDNQHEILLSEIIKLLMGGGAHATLEDALDALPQDLRGARVDGLPYTIWQLVEHIRIAQWDMMKFSKDQKHESPPWPEGYWAKENAPGSEAEWEQSLMQIADDRDEFIQLLKSADIYKAIPHGQGQSILREAFQIADHNAYHIAEIIVVRRLMGAW